MIIIKTTTDSHKAMKLIANTLLNKKLAACVNMIKNYENWLKDFVER